MATAHSRRLARRRRPSLSIRRAFVEPLEERLLLNGGPPQVVSHDLPSLSEAAVSSATFTLSEAVGGQSARNPASYELIRLGPDQTLGGGDDAVQQIIPAYSDGTTQIDLDFRGAVGPLSLDGWSHVAPGGGREGYWFPDTHELLVQTGASLSVGVPSFYISPTDFIEGRFQTRLRVIPSVHDDFVGVVFAMQRSAPQQSTFLPNDYYALTWKRTTETASFTHYSDLTAEEGLKLIRAEDTSGWPNYMIGPFLWDGVHPMTGDRLQVLDSSLGEDKGWEYDTDYDITIDYSSDGTIGVGVRRVGDGAIIWQTSVVDASPLGAGRVGFFNMGQPGVEYRSLGTTEELREGLYQLSVYSGEPGLRDLEGLALDGDGDGAAGGNFTATSLIDFAAPEVTKVYYNAQQVSVTFADLGGMDRGRITDVDNYRLVASGGDGVLDDEDDLPIAITGITWEAGTYGYERAVLSFASPLESERYRLTVDGTDGVRDRFGRDLLSGDYTQQFNFSTGPTQFALDLPTDLDTGVSHEDNLTRLSNLEIDVVIDRPGRLRLDLDNNSKYETDVYLPHAGTYTYAAPYSSDGEHRSRGSFVPAYGSSDLLYLSVTIDTQVPSVVQYSPFGAGHPSTDHLELQFSEGIATGSLTLGDIRMQGPQGSIVPTAIDDLGGNTFRIDFPPQSSWGVYQVVIDPVVADAAGNQIDTDGDRVSGEVSDDALNLNFLIGYEGVNIAVDGSFETAGASSGTPNSFGIWSGDRSAWVSTFYGVVPMDGSKMHRFLDTGSTAKAGVTWGDVWQLVDLASFAEDVATGEALFWASSQFNRDEGIVNGDTQFAVSLAAYAGDPSTFPAQLGTGELATAQNFLFTDNEEETWQGLSAGLTLPASTDFVAVKISAIENVRDDSSSYEFTAHYADAVSAVLVVPLDKPYIVDSSPQGSIAIAADHFDVTFSEPIDASTFTVEDVWLVGPDGGHPVSSPVHLEDNVWRIGFTPLTVEGDYEYSLGPDIRDLQGRKLDQNRDGGAGDPVRDVYHATLRIDFTPLAIDSHLPVGEQHHFIDYVDVVFSEEIAGSTFAPSDVMLTGPTGPIAVLDPSRQQGNTWRIPFVEQQSAGTYTIVIGPQVDDLAGHSMLAPYTGTFSIRLADLIGSGLEVPAVGGSGNDLTLAWRTANEGSVLADGLWADHVYLSDDAVPGGDTWLASFNRPTTLEPGAFYDQAATVTLPQVAEGDYWLVVVVDGEGTIDEANESDNVLVAGPVIIRRPNLAVSNLVFPTEGAPGERLPFGCTVTNVGAVPTSGSWYDAGYLSVDEVLDDNDVQLGAFALPPDVVAPGGGYDRLRDWDISEVPAGDYYLIVKADSRDVLAESDETDNIAVAGPIRVKS
ncbi:MAG: CARDB domain-containing protein, partial [Pirellulaceae bacterium]